MRLRQRLHLDGFTIALFATVVLASVLPMRGQAAQVLDLVTDAAIALLFFLHGAKLSRQAIVSGMTAWRLHLLILAATFVLFPVLGLAMQPLSSALLTPELALGMLFLCALPSTVQSSIAFTSMAGGNVPAAVCAASLSSLLGIFLTPLLVGLMTGAQGQIDNPLASIGAIVLQLLVPFVVGHLLRPWIGDWVDRHRPLIRWTDQGTILLVVYSAFGAAVLAGLWQDTPATALLALAVLSCVILAIVMPLLVWLARRCGFNRADRIAILFCGSKKSLASGVPIAKVLFASSALGAVMLPVMIFHQIQLVVCSMVAQRYARQASTHGASAVTSDR